MKIYGIDFTSAPSARKPLVCAHARLQGQTLNVTHIEQGDEIGDFDSWLLRSGRWLMAVDMPLGQPRPLIEALDWPREWEKYVSLVDDLGPRRFTDQLAGYSRDQPPGNKHHFRPTDRAASACSPMMVFGVPVAKMFAAGAPRIAKADVSVLPCRPNQSPRVVVEAYPALVARQLAAGQPYKGGPASDRVARARMRQRMLRRLTSDQEHFPFEIQLQRGMKKLAIDDNTGDILDAILAVVQLARAYAQHGSKLGMPSRVDPIEGWIVGTSWDDDA